MKNNVDLPKLPRGEGSFEYYKDKIRYRKRIKLDNGQIISKSVTGNSVMECFQKMIECEKSINDRYKNQLKRTLSEMMYEWLDLRKKPSLKIQSYNRLKTVIHNQIEKYDIGNIRWNLITSKDIQNHITYLNEVEHYSKSVIKKTYDALNDFYRYMENSENISNPMKTVIMPITDNIVTEERNIEYFDEEDIKLFIEEATQITHVHTLKYRYGAILSANIYMGLRIGELLALKWKDIDFDKRTVYVSKTIIQEDNPDYDKNNPILMKEKNIHKVRFVVQNSTKKSKNRFVPLNDKAIELIKLHLDHAAYKGSDNFVISSSTEKNCNVHNMNTVIHTIEKNAETKVQKSGTHVLRHTCASLYFKNNVPIEIICKILGNSREVCEKTYVHFTEQQLQDEANKIATSYI